MEMMQQEQGGGGKQKKMSTRVDFTPMVDMLMLLITFFMLCTSLSKPSTMELTMPSNDKDQSEAKKNEAKESHSITIFIGEGDKMFYGEGKPQLDNPAWLKPADWSTNKTGIRYVLQHKEVDNGRSVPYNDMRIAMQDLNKKKLENPAAYPDSIYQAEVAQIKMGTINGKKVPTMTVIIKPTDKASYRHLVDILDEMQISYIGTYVIDKLSDEEKALLRQKGIQA